MLKASNGVALLKATLKICKINFINIWIIKTDKIQTSKIFDISLESICLSVAWICLLQDTLVGQYGSRHNILFGESLVIGNHQELGVQVIVWF